MKVLKSCSKTACHCVIKSNIIFNEYKYFAKFLYKFPNKNPTQLRQEVDFVGTEPIKCWNSLFFQSLFTKHHAKSNTNSIRFSEFCCCSTNLCNDVNHKRVGASGRPLTLRISWRNPRCERKRRGVLWTSNKLPTPATSQRIRGI